MSVKIFGDLKGAQGKIEYTTAIDVLVKTDSFTGYELSKEIGLQSKIENYDKIAEALGDPKVYITSKNTNLKLLNEQLLKHYANQLLIYLNAGFARKEAQKRATESVNVLKKELMEIHYKNYPTEIVDKLISKVQKQKGL